MDSRFTGRVTMYSTRDNFPGPKVVEVPFGARFSAPTWLVARADFADGGAFTLPDIQDPTFGALTLTVTLEKDASGTFDNATRAVSLNVRFAFYIAGRTSVLKLLLDGGAYSLDRPGQVVTGAPFDPASGDMTIAGKGRFDGGWLAGDRCLLLVQGRFTPNPWA